MVNEKRIQGISSSSLSLNFNARMPGTESTVIVAKSPMVKVADETPKWRRKSVNQGQNIFPDLYSKNSGSNMNENKLYSNSIVTTAMATATNKKALAALPSTNHKLWASAKNTCEEA